MFRTTALACLTALGLLGTAAAPSFAHVPLPRPAYLVEFRQLQWKERVFLCHAQAHQFEALKRSQGFETVVLHHGIDFHVRYRLACWRSFRLVYSHAEAHALEHALEHRGYQARVVHRY